MIIALSGIDGSGKTTIAKKLKAVLEINNTGVPVVYKHVSSYFLLQPFINLFNNKPTRSNDNRFLIVKKKPFFFNLWAFIAFLDFVFFYFYLRIISFKKVVICDRYIYDRMLGLRYFGYSSEKINYFLLRFIPIDYLFILTVSPELALSREEGDTHDATFFSIMTAWYMDLLKYNPKLVCINASHRIDVIVNEVLNSIYEDFNKL